MRLPIELVEEIVLFTGFVKVVEIFPKIAHYVYRKKYNLKWAVINGDLEIVKWLYHNRKEGCTTDVMIWAVEYGHLEILKWLHTNCTEGCTKWVMDLQEMGA